MKNFDEIKYVIITPARDEELNIEKTLESVISQTIRPLEWIIVDDGSTDKTGNIIEECAGQYDWIRALLRGNRGFRKSGAGVVEAFYDGYDSLKQKEWDFIVKLDGDLSFDMDYFEKCFDYFKLDKKLGIGGGTINYIDGGKLRPEKNSTLHVRGATKIYRRGCWDAIGGLISAPGWDTVDEVKANMLGWETRSFLDIQVIHHRNTGEADGVWRNSVKDGLADYTAGYHPLFMFFKCAKRVISRPYVIGSMGLMYGFLSGYVNKAPMVDDPALIAYLRKEQMKRLILRSSIWR